ncbi:MAG: agmatinase [Proteobacteria bacterium]|nr:agmatinase [Pseudomonadota bacterium]MBU1709266.1 agmatinase [Pseudomonadota bacterium]
MSDFQFLDKDEACECLALIKRVSLISAPLASSVSWGKGTDRGPGAIIDASKALEVFDDELKVETFRAGIETLPPLQLAGLSAAEALKIIEESVDTALLQDRLPVVLGGEHTVTLPAVRACARQYPDLQVIQFDAHLDLRDSYQGNPLSHACVMRRIDDLGLRFLQVGIRSFSREEWDFISGKGLQPYFMERIHNEEDWMERFCSELAENIYITFDVDALDPSIMPATGTPEPDGLTWAQTTRLLRKIIRTGKVVGLDFVEFSPIADNPSASFTVAKLIYRTLGYILSPLISDSK